MTAWIACDWGTSNLRLWALDADGRVLAERTSDKGMGRLAPDGYEPALLDLATQFLPADVCPFTVPVPVIVCGMAGARQGWREAPYLPVPCVPSGAGAVRVATRDPRLEVHILPGLSQTDPADVMRGEETQIAGLLHGDPGFDGVLCLPGTHSKWVRAAGGRVLHFGTVMTGELFALLSEHSVLRHTVGGGEDPAAFDAAVTAALADPAGWMTRLFPLRAEALLGDLSPATAGARLSGGLIGAELAAMRATWQGQQVALIGADRLSDLYARALTGQGVPVTRHDARALTLAGLKAAHAALGKVAA
ncbi:2-dehydro-3-deoxygalactonokinase [Chachezhania sediminis]|uniref:2-dehydro-3-deoxygalactonokinase n=1 Tax=Chachezhania sediminis TaxID=2599291 RepID=UPI00131E3533|nr:2-dehydro-3-deoxygalactonokinase [Chachezhania sediminis]